MVEVSLASLSEHNDLLIVERWFSGERFVVTKQDGEVSARPSSLFDRVPEALFDGLTDCDFRVVGSIVTIDSMDLFFVEDVMYFNGKDLSDSEWDDRYVVLRNGFDWGTSVRRVNPIVVSSNSDLEVACRTVSKLPGSQGAFVRWYDEGLYGDSWVIPEEEVVRDDA